MIVKPIVCLETPSCQMYFCLFYLMFYKFYKKSSNKEEDNELGFALVKQILSACGRTITAENIPEGGRQIGCHLVEKPGK